MEKQRQNNYARITKQVDRLRSIYSQIGEPLPADVIIDLYHHLGSVLECSEKPKPGICGKKRRMQA